MSPSTQSIDVARPALDARKLPSSAHSPHVVIRGETLPPKNLVLHSAHIDWLAFTLTPPQEAAEAPMRWLLPHLFSLLNIPSVTCVSTGKG